MNYCVECAANGITRSASEIHFGLGYCEVHSRGWHPVLKGGEMKFRVGDRVKVYEGFGTIVSEEGADTFGVMLDKWPGRKLLYLSECFQSKKLPGKSTPRKSIRRELKSLKSDLRQLASEAGCKDRVLGERIDLIADKLGGLVERI